MMAKQQVGPYTGNEDTESQLNKANMKRFNENVVDDYGPRS